MKVFWWIALFCLSVFFVLSVGAYYGLGVDEYYVKMNMVKNLDSSINGVTERVKSEFSGDTDTIYNGTLMAISKIGEGGVWVWGRKGPKYYRADEYTVFSYYSMCGNPDLIDRLDNGEVVDPSREITQDVIEWSHMIQVGQYIVVMRTVEGQGGKIGNLREAWVYDWWPMIPSDLRSICAEK